MSPFEYLSLLLIIGCNVTTATMAIGTLPGETAPVLELGKSKSSDVEASPKNYPCPEATDIDPCICTVDTEGFLYMDCSSVLSNEELNNVFTNEFPVNKFEEFRLTNNDYFTQLQVNCFGNVTFSRIWISNTNIDFVSSFALASSAERLNYIHIFGGFLTDQQFPFIYLDTYTNLTHLEVSGQVNLTLIPLLTSNTLTDLEMEFCAIANISQGNT